KAKYLVGLCSPGAVSSSCVWKEIRWFLANRGNRWVIPIVTEATEPLTRPQDCFPADIIDNRLHESFIWYDLRGLNRSTRTAKVKNYEDEIVRLASDLLEWDSTTKGPLSTIW